MSKGVNVKLNYQQSATECHDKLVDLCTKWEMPLDVPLNIDWWQTLVDKAYKKGVEEAGNKIIEMFYNKRGYFPNDIVINDIRTVINNICEGGEKNGSCE